MRQWVWPAFRCSNLREALWWMMSSSRWRSMASRGTRVEFWEALISDSASVSTSSFSFLQISSSSFPSSNDVTEDREGVDGGRGHNFCQIKKKTGIRITHTFSVYTDLTVQLWVLDRLAAHLHEGRVHDCWATWRQCSYALSQGSKTSLHHLTHHLKQLCTRTLRQNNAHHYFLTLDNIQKYHLMPCICSQITYIPQEEIKSAPSRHHRLLQELLHRKLENNHTVITTVCVCARV